MKMVAVITLVLVAEAVAAGSIREDVKLVVCLNGGVPGLILQRATRIASRMYAGIGIPIEWQYGARHCADGSGFLIRFADRAPMSASEGALASAKPWAGTVFDIYYMRVTERVQPSQVEHVLAHVIVHELGHMLQATGSHSDEGVMKANWTTSDYREMCKSPLEFTEHDVQLIHKGFRNWFDHGSVMPAHLAMNRAR